MIEGSVEFGPLDQRKQRRYSFSSRVSLAAGLAVLEGLIAALLLLLALRLTVPLHAQAAYAVMLQCVLVAAIFGVLSFTQMRRVLAFTDSRHHQAAGAILAAIVSLALAGIVTAASGLDPWGMAELGWPGLLVASLSLVGLRLGLGRYLRTMMRAGRLQVERLALIGRPEAVLRFEQETPPWQRGGQVIARHNLDEQGALGDFIAFCVARRCDTLVLVGQMNDMAVVHKVAAACDRYALNVLFAPVPSAAARQQRLLDVLPLGPSNAVRVLRPPLDDWERSLKRLFDFTIALVTLVVLSPLLLAIAALLKLTSPGPALYRQERQGFNGESFYILKFRSMRVMEDGRAMKPVVADDPRITPIGRFLRRTSLDELPQLINVLRGEMSLVGPRPHGISHDAELSQRFDLYARRQRITPGITGWAQVNGYRGDVSTQQRIEGRTLHDLHYVENWSLGFDLWILWLTVFSARTRSNAE